MLAVRTVADTCTHVGDGPDSSDEHVDRSAATERSICVLGHPRAGATTLYRALEDGAPVSVAETMWTEL